MRAELEDSFTRLASAELPRLRRFAYGICGDWHRADDMVQLALKRMYLRWPRIHTAADPGAYARTVVARVAISETRRPWWRRERISDAVPEVAAADDVAVAVDRMDIAQALSGLAPKQRAVVVLRFLEDRSVDEVAEILGIAPGTVKRQSHDAIAHLRRRLHVTDHAQAAPGVSEPQKERDA
ncbi:SigE family RNA polymerase sigma factor [Phytoactinopolyspora halotolerans]|uniref:SigE family RNA polymerase sigma factor n=1 Tax=Phytoactinopolyspora halotolerans TaxID=1981512 RepID=A0A6L9SAI9_9ACTN|nr:SigE family RNA polymerase sigma factor [Phytoactinopolyspora halotolerans]NEE01631.1 SigE family RNA polymerase sigma factor [Phytoactinopolyspora halotolerans]